MFYLFFKKFKTIIKTHSGCKINSLKLDRGKEYISPKFDQFYANERVYHQLTITCTLGQNGIFERRNKIIIEMPYNMLFEKKLPNKFCIEAINTIVYLLNKILLDLLKKKLL